MTRIFKLKGFSRFQRKERILHTALAYAIGRIEAGSPDADLGGDVIKQRIACRGQGESGGYRTVIAIRRGDRAFFLYGFAKTNAAISTTRNWTNSGAWREAILGWTLSNWTL